MGYIVRTKSRFLHVESGSGPFNGKWQTGFGIPAKERTQLFVDSRKSQATVFETLELAFEAAGLMCNSCLIGSRSWNPFDVKIINLKTGKATRGFLKWMVEERKRQMS